MGGRQSKNTQISETNETKKTIPLCIECRDELNWIKGKYVCTGRCRKKGLPNKEWGQMQIGFDYTI